MFPWTCTGKTTVFLYELKITGRVLTPKVYQRQKKQGAVSDCLT
jgi:hypothetical protein